MKRIIYILTLLLIAVTANAQIVCCPKFSLQANQSVFPCKDDSSCRAGGSAADPVGNPSPAQVNSIVACKNSTQTYYVVPNMPGFTYTWQVTGGTPASFTGNPGIITWGSGGQGFIKVLISNAAGTCKDSVFTKVCLIDAPVAAFTASPGSTVCVSNPTVQFTNTSTGATTYNWDFNDGTTASTPNPSHTFPGIGTYTVVLTVTNTPPGSANGEPNRCGCTDTATMVINVVAGSGPTINTTCKKMLCAGDTATYCATGCSGPYSWTVVGGTPTSGTGNCIQVTWNPSPGQQPSITLTAGGSCGPCGNSTTLNVPVLFNNIPITPTNMACQGSTVTYSMAALPGTFYNWTVTGGSIVGPITNTHQITVTWGAGPVGNISCSYQNPYTGCSGSTMQTIQIRPKFTMTGPASVCTGAGTFFSTNGAGNWTIGAPASAYTFGGSLSSVPAVNITNWNAAGTYNISAVPTVPASFCNPSANITLVVKPKPLLSTISGPTLVCAGNFDVYAVTSNLPGTFNWSVSGGSIISQMGAGNDSVVVQWTAGGGTLNVSQTVNGCTTTASLNVTTINAIGTPAGNINVCMDVVETYTIAGPVPPGGYTWSLSNPLGTILGYPAPNSVQIQWNGSVTPGTATCNIQASGCSLNSSLLVNVKTPANGTLTALGNMCTPGVTLTASIPGSPASYDWYRNGVFLTNTVAPTYLTNLPGFYKVVGKTGCFGYATVTVPNTFTSTVTISTGNTLAYCPSDPISVTFVATVQSNITCTYSYQWFMGVTPVTGNSPANTSYTATTTGTYYVVITCGACTATSNSMTITQAPVPSTPCSNGCTILYDFDNPFMRSGNVGGPADIMTPEKTDAPPPDYSITILPPVVATPNCNVATFSANYYFNAPNFTPNSGVFWNFGDGGTATSTYSGNAGTSTAPPHTYTVPGIYVITASMTSLCLVPPPAHICYLQDTIRYVVPVAANFGYNINCKTVTLSDLSSTLPSLGCNITSWNWSVSGPAGASFNNNALQNPVLTVLLPGVYNVTLTVNSSCGTCSATVTYPVTITAPTASFTLPSPVCAGTAVPFATTGSAGNTYNWNFGDTYQSNQQNTTHTFGLIPATPTVILTVTDVMGCTATAQQTINVVAPPVITITPNQFICPGSTGTITAATGFSNYAWYHNGNLVQNGASNTYTTGNTGSFWVVASNGSGCNVKSIKTNIFLHPKPVAAIQGSSTACLYGGTGNIYLYNSVNDAPNGTAYSWLLSGGTASPTNNFDITVNITTPGNYTYVLTATNQYGCVTKDTFCVVAGHAPAVTVTPSTSGGMCAGTKHTFTASATPVGPTYVYQWSNGVSGPVMTTSAAGSYFVNVLNPLSGCSANNFAGIVKPRPTTILFPAGCDTLCDTAKIIPPLALGAGQNYSIYSIQWLNNGVPISPQPTPQHILPLASLTPGLHNLSIIVTYNGCSDTSNVYNLFVKHCGDCNCDKSDWSELYWQYNSAAIKQPAASNVRGAKAIVPAGAKPFKCGDNLGVLDCKKPVTFFAAYKCSPDSCNQAVKYVLTGTDINGPVNLTGNMPFSTAPLLQGNYTLTMIGKCGDSICKRCEVKFEIKCDSIPPKDCCRGSQWEGTPWYYFNTTGALKVKIDCGSETVILITGDKCKIPLVVGANIICPTNCNGNVTVTVKDGLGNVILTGPSPLSITGLTNGTYTAEINGYCGGVLCLVCKLIIKVDCKPPVDCCKGSKWGDKTIAIAGTIKKLNCPGEYNVKCNLPITINANYNCATKDCSGNVTYSLQPPTGAAINGNVPLTFTPSQSGTYVLTLYGTCGGVVCDSCLVKFKVDCPPPPCCPYNIIVKDPVVNTTTLASPPATIANANFGISGTLIPSGAPISGNLFTEIRAEVVSYALYDNFGGECLNCKSYPYTWASMYQPGNVSGIPPAITLFNSTSNSFNPAGSGMYQNPREVVWTSSTPFALPSNINLSFLLPSASIITCCELTAKICVKFTFRDKDCKECEVIVCFPVVIKPGGGNPPPKDCNCKIEPFFQYEGGSKAVNCGQSLTLFQGNIPVSMQPNFTCKDGNGNDCPSQSPSVTISKNGGPSTTLTSPAYNFTFLQPGSYEYTIVGVCAGKKCECKVTVKIP